ncbi:hypothetical protein WNY61_04315 [Sulfitobacter sp. AS92]|uniref:hypothetical protein n=1 Tax=Sulfitobacter sp. AS92 TaxID=3135783 RepID=UPI00316FF682
MTKRDSHCFTRLMQGLALGLSMLVIYSTGAQAQGRSIRLSDDFDSVQVSREEARILQGALALERSYDGLLDGAWGRGSAAALNQWVRSANGGQRATWRDIRALIRNFEAERSSNDWAPAWHSETGVWHIRPETLLQDQSTDGEERLASPDGGLILIARPAFERPEALHNEFVRDALQGTSPYRLSQSDRIVTAAEMRGGRFAYVRSDRAGTANSATPWMTHIVIANETNRGRLQLIASSFARSRMQSLDPAPTNVLAALLQDGSALPAPPPSQSAGPNAPGRSGDPLEAILGLILTEALERLTEKDDTTADLPSVSDRRLEKDRRLAEERRRDAERLASASTTGIFVNTTDIIAPDELNRFCSGSVRLENGPVLTQVARDPNLRLAVYAAPGRSNNWVPLVSGLPRLGAGVTLAVRSDRDGLRSARGTVASNRSDSALRIDINDRELGGDGAPLLGDGEALIGMWTGDRDRQGRLDAISAMELVSFFDRERVPFGTPAENFDRSGGLGENTRQAIVRLRCAVR